MRDMLMLMGILSGSKRSMEFVYSNDGYTFTGDPDGDWELQLLTTGDITFISIPTAIDVHIVGGGGAGAAGFGSGGGGGGGYVTTIYGLKVNKNTPYTIVVGAGATANGGSGGSSSAFGESADGGEGGVKNKNGGAGGSGGAAASSGGRVGANGGSDGSDGESRAYAGGKGSGKTTKDFRTGTLRAGGGGGGAYIYNGYPSQGVGGAGGGGNGGIANYTGDATGKYYVGAYATSGSTNFGGGGGGASNTTDSTYGKGGSGIVIIRNAR